MGRGGGGWGAGGVELCSRFGANCAGAGDTLVGVFAKALLDKTDNYRVLEIGMDAAIHSLKCADRVIPTKLG